jgi:two-component system response regulator YesN
MYNLLIVDDEPLVRRGIKTLVDFDSLGISEVYEAENGEQALELFHANTIHIILADINMPKMNGLDFAKAIKTEDANVCIALITGYDYFDYAVSALKAGVDDYILKPVSKKDIYEVLVKLVDKCKDIGREQKLQTLTLNDNSVNSSVSDQTSEDQLLSDKPEFDDTYKAQLKQLLDENIGNPELSLGFLAEKVGLSSGYLSGIFKKLFGLSFQEYVLKKRLDKAKILLLTTNMKNYEVAESVGFEDASYFSSRFKKMFGISPKQYKHSIEN